MDSLLSKLEEYSKTATAMHMPGHKRRTDLPYLKKLAADCDITEIDGFDNLHDPEGILADCMTLAAEVWGSRDSFFLINGSTGGILASIYAATSYGDEIIMARNCHKAMYNAVLIRGLRPTYLLPEMLACGICGEITAEAVEAAFVQSPNAKAVVITSPTYEGIISDVHAIAEVVHSHGAVLIVDAAHGAHLGFGHGFPDGAISAGADIVIQSLHKTLLCLTQTAILHRCSDRISTQALRSALAIFQSSSPSYLLMSAIDGCVRALKDHGDELFENWKRGLDLFYSATEKLQKLKVLTRENMDRSKLVILTDSAGITGHELMDILRRGYSIELEMASAAYVVAMTGMGDTGKSIVDFAEALISIDESLAENGEKQGFTLSGSLPKHMMSPAEAEVIAGEYVDYSGAIGRVCLDYVWAYPPGIPMIVPGEVVDNKVVSDFITYEKYGVELKSTKKSPHGKIFVGKFANTLE